MTRLAAIVVVLAACAHPPPARPMRTFLAAATELDTIREVMLRYLFTDSAAQLHCIELVPNDPPPAFLARFADLAVPVAPASACGVGADGGIHDKATGRRATLFRILEVTWDDDTGKASVSADKIAGNVGGAGFTYALRLVDGHWRIESAQPVWVSRL